MRRQFCIFACFAAGLTLGACSLFSPKPVPYRYQAEPVYPPVLTPTSHHAAQPQPSPSPVPQSSRVAQHSSVAPKPSSPPPPPAPEPPSNAPKNETPVDVDSLPFANSLPGEPNVVTLPESFGADVEIDVTGIDPGTAVEIPNPNKPGETIQFRVPYPES